MKTLYIPLVILLLVVAGRTFKAGAQTETNLYSFVGSPTDGAAPEAGLVQGSDGNFYGTTFGGGTGLYGTVFRISPSGSETNLYSFGTYPTDGRNPGAGLTQGSDGNFYGTTSAGGASTNCSGGCGTVFRISPSGTYTSLYSFGSSPNDGSGPNAGLVQGSDGNFYGTTYYGGTYGDGAVFRISPSGTETNLYSFGSSPSDGQNPIRGLVQGSDGNFYGTTFLGGTTNGGTVFRIGLSGTETNLYSFGSSPSDGVSPEAGLVQGSDGNFYGITHHGGTTSYGTVFRISPSGNETNLYSFVSNPGPLPEVAGLVQGSDGNFYGTTEFRGEGSGGTVFRISPSGSETTLYAFVESPPSDGFHPRAGLVQGSDGNFYGTTANGGTNNLGTVFKLTVPLNSPANQISGIQLSGTNVVLAILAIAGETYQLQSRNSLTSGSWSNVPGVSVTNSIGALLTLTNFGGAVGAQGFYRFAITP